MESRDSSIWKMLSQKILLLSEMNSFVPNVDNNRTDTSAIDQSERVIQNMVEILKIRNVSSDNRSASWNLKEFLSKGRRLVFYK